jgi:hypothetical protein
MRTAHPHAAHTLPPQMKQPSVRRDKRPGRAAARGARRPRCRRCCDRPPRPRRARAVLGRSSPSVILSRGTRARKRRRWPAPAWASEAAGVGEPCAWPRKLPPGRGGLVWRESVKAGPVEAQSRRVVGRAPGRSYRTNGIAANNYCSGWTPPRRVRPPAHSSHPTPGHTLLSSHCTTIMKQARPLGQPPLPGQRFVDRDLA